MSKFFKKERLCSKKHIDKLFVVGKSFIKYPLRITFSFEKSQSHFFCQVIIIVPKKRIRKAIDRNLIKRRIREAYRNNKVDLCSVLKEKGLHANFAILYVSNEIKEYREINAAIQKSFQSLNEVFNNS